MKNLLTKGLPYPKSMEKLLFQGKFVLKCPLREDLARRRGIFLRLNSLNHFLTAMVNVGV
jgi:hypothetical protein